MPTAVQLFKQAYTAYCSNDHDESLALYQKCIQKILKDERLTQPLPALSASTETPQELLGIAFNQLTSFFRGGPYSQGTCTVFVLIRTFSKWQWKTESAPEAYKLINSFRPGGNKEYPRFTTPEQQLLLKAIQINAGLTLGLIAWDKKDRAAASKRYKETLDLAATHSPWNSVDPRSKYLNRWAADSVQQVKDNLAMIVQNDTINSQMAQLFGSQTGDFRRDKVQIPNARIDASGEAHFGDSVSMATDACGRCGTRGVKLSRCSKCKKIACKCTSDYAHFVF